jgi:hypothetical protein
MQDNDGFLDKYEYPFTVPPSFNLPILGENGEVRFAQELLRLAPQLTGYNIDHADRIDNLRERTIKFLQMDLSSDAREMVNLTGAIEEELAYARMARYKHGRIPMQDLFGAANTQYLRYHIPVSLLEACAAGGRRDLPSILYLVWEVRRQRAVLDCHGDPSGSISAAVKDEMRKYASQVAYIYGEVAWCIAGQYVVPEPLAIDLLTELSEPKTLLDSIEQGRVLAEILARGAAEWNAWRADNLSATVDLRQVNFGVRPTLQNFNLSGANLAGVLLPAAQLYNCDLSDAHMPGVCLNQATISDCKFLRANLRGAEFRDARLPGNDLTDVDLSGADLQRANLHKVRLDGAKLIGASLVGATVVRTSFKRAELRDTIIFGAAVWDIEVDETTIQENIRISDEPPMSCDDIEVAQVINLFRTNRKITSIIESATARMVLILGRFTPERKQVLDRLKKELSHWSPPLIPIVFDFKGPSTLNFIEMVGFLAHLSAFVIADVTDAKIVLEEIPHIVTSVAVPVKPLIMGSKKDEPVTLNNYRRNHRSLMETLVYADVGDLLARLNEDIVLPALELRQELKLLPSS